MPCAYFLPGPPAYKGPGKEIKIGIAPGSTTSMGEQAVYSLIGIQAFHIVLALKRRLYLSPALPLTGVRTWANNSISSAKFSTL